MPKTMAKITNVANVSQILWVNEAGLLAGVMLLGL